MESRGMPRGPTANSLLFAVSAFDAWAAQVQLFNTESIESIGNPKPKIGIDATHLLEEWYYPRREPLIPALGGLPFALESQIDRFVKILRSAGIQPYFYFNGLDTACEEVQIEPSNEASNKIAQAFQIYDSRQDKQTIERFKASGFPDIRGLCGALKAALEKNDIQYFTAPFKVYPQMAHALADGQVHGLYGPTELFLYGVPKLFTKIQLAEEPIVQENGQPNELPNKRFVLEGSTVQWIELAQCLKMLGDVPFETFQHAMFFVGSKGLARFPPLRNSSDPQASMLFKEVITSLMQLGGNPVTFFNRYPAGVRGDWWRRWIMAQNVVKHGIIYKRTRDVAPRTKGSKDPEERLPSDLHLAIGLQLCPELHHYVYHGLIGPRVLNWLDSGKIKLFAPLSGGGSDVYRKLVTEQLSPWRKQCLALIAQPLNRYWHTKDIATELWYQGKGESFNMKDLTSPKKSIATWRVKQSALDEQLLKVQKTQSQASLGDLYFALKALTDPSFVTKSIFPAQRPSSEPQLKSFEEITCNTLWRFLQLRGYVNAQHQLTEWGRVLLTALEKATNPKDHSESILVAVELIRLGLLDSNPDLFKDIGGLPKNGSEKDKANVILVSRLACVGRLAHAPMGYMGPLNHHMLAYHSLITEIRLTLRDLIDMALVTMFLDDEVERTRVPKDELKLGAALPFRQHPSCGLGIFTSLLCDDSSTGSASAIFPVSDALSQNLKAWFAQCNVDASMKNVREIWDAVHIAVGSGPDSLIGNGQKAAWKETNQWLTGKDST